MASMSENDLLLAVAVRSYIKKKRKRRFAVHPLNSVRLVQGQFHTLITFLRNDEDKFFSYFRMSTSTFDELLSLIKDNISKKSTTFKTAISAEERLAVSLRFLATGNTFRSLSFEYRIGRSTISYIVRHTCNAIWDHLKGKVMNQPTKEDWERMAKEFNDRANFPNCIGALDGKHIRVVRPEGSGSQFFNYKHFYSVVLLALVDANYCFTVIDVGHYGKSADSNIFRQSTMNKLLFNGQFNVPDNKALPGFENTIKLPHVIVADEAFPMSKNVMRPYARKDLTVKKRVFNYRLSRARRYVECAFGIFSNKWRIFHNAIHLDTDFVKEITLACCVLHNFVRVRDGFQFDDTLSCPMDDIPVVGTGGSCERSKNVRDLFADYFTSPAGCLPWQYDKI